MEPLIYTFSKKGLAEANKILIDSAENIDNKTLIIIDEYGRLESKGIGIFHGFTEVINKDPQVDSLLIICRTDKADEVFEIVKEKPIEFLFLD